MLPPSCVKSLFIGSTEEFQNERLKKRPRPAGFWQMPCPRARLDDSLSIRRVNRGWTESGQQFKSKKMGKSRNFNRDGPMVHLDEVSTERGSAGLPSPTDA